MRSAHQMMFRVGQVVSTPGAAEAFARTGEDWLAFLGRHLCGDWGELCAEDVHQNELAVRHGYRILSQYTLMDQTKIWVITEADRALTTFLLPDEY